jgi:hypothetical protein
LCRFSLSESICRCIYLVLSDYKGAYIHPCLLENPLETYLNL